MFLARDVTDFGEIHRLFVLFCHSYIFRLLSYRIYLWGIGSIRPSCPVDLGFGSMRREDAAATGVGLVSAAGDTPPTWKKRSLAANRPSASGPSLRGLGWFFSCLF